MCSPFYYNYYEGLLLLKGEGREGTGEEGLITYQDLGDEQALLERSEEKVDKSCS